uniref:Fungal lipase-type domain-containing protein n=1 Tax=Oryza punctata TaxID=4537 RepID=A0A0E0KYM0_ORYPU
MVAGAGGGAAAAKKKKKMGEEKLIIRSEKVRFIDILSLLLLRRPITSYHFVEAGDATAAGELGSTPGEWLVALTEIVQKALAAAYYPAKYLGAAVEFFLNFVSLNGGLLGILWNIVRFKLVIPLNREAPNFRSMIAMIDGRTELKPMKPAAAGLDDEDLESGGCAADVPLIRRHYVDGERLLAEQYSISEVTVMAAKIAYENAAYIENVVNNVWKFNFVGFYSCWNKFIGSETTQAFVMTERAKDAAAIVVAFRGTEPFNMQDWSTDVNLSWLGMGAMGHVHVGFLKALGLQEVDGNDAGRAFPRDPPAAASLAGKSFAYYKLRDVLRDQLRRHPNARVVVTGHSLGGALAAAFPALLAFHGEADVVSRLAAVHTYGQPRVGDATFAGFLSSNAATPATVSSLRVVYRYDIVPRVPFDVPPVADFRHGGTCVYYDGWYAGRTLTAGEDAPNKNYFNPRYIVSMYGNAWGDMFKAMFLWAKEGKDYREGAVSIVYRTAGLLFPGLASHSPRDYVNAIRLGRVAPKEA